MLNCRIEHPMPDGSFVVIRGWRMNAAERAAVGAYLETMAQGRQPLPPPAALPPPPPPLAIEATSRP